MHPEHTTSHRRHGIPVLPTAGGRNHDRAKQSSRRAVEMKLQRAAAVSVAGDPRTDAAYAGTEVNVLEQEEIARRGIPDVVAAVRVACRLCLQTICGDIG